MRTALTEVTQRKKDGAICGQCGKPIWAIGSAITGWDGCHACITGGEGSAEDYEIRDVCF